MAASIHRGPGRAEQEQAKRPIEQKLRQRREEKEEKDGLIRGVEEWLGGHWYSL